MTDTPTGDFGVTTKAKKDIEKKTGQKFTDEEAAQAILKDHFSILSDNLPGFDATPPGVTAAILDLSYNVGTGLGAKKGGILNFPRLVAALAGEDFKEVMIQTLDTAQADNKSVAGLAVRRAQNYNAAGMTPPIASVQQLPNGINYIGPDGVVIFGFTKPKSKSSKVGKKKIKQVAEVPPSRVVN